MNRLILLIFIFFTNINFALAHPLNTSIIDLDLNSSKPNLSVRFYIFNLKTPLMLNSEPIAQTVYDKDNPNYELLKINLEILKKENDAQGNKLEIIEMPYLPYFSQLYNNTQYVSPYTNYYVANKSVLVPEVDPKLDEKAYKLIQDIYIDRTIVPIPAFYQAIGGGGPGCITQQLPKSINTSV